MRVTLTLTDARIMHVDGWGKRDIGESPLAQDERDLMNSTLDVMRTKQSMTGTLAVVRRITSGGDDLGPMILFTEHVMTVSKFDPHP